MHGIGLREWVALGVLALAAVFAFMFFDPASTDGGNDVPSAISLGDPAPTSTPVAAATATPIPAKQLKEPGGSWFLTYFSRSASARETREGEGFVPRLAIDEPGRPFPDFQDDAWRVEARQSFDLAGGRYRFALETDGAVKVTLGDQVVIDAEDASSPQRRGVEFDHAGGNLTILISVRDTGGPVRLRWVD